MDSVAHSGGPQKESSEKGHPKRRKKSARKHFCRRKNAERKRQQARRARHETAQSQDGEHIEDTTTRSVATVVTFHESMSGVTLPQHWLAIPSDNALQWSRFEVGPSGLWELTLSVLLKNDLTWSVFIYGRRVPPTCKLFASYPSTISSPDIVTNLIKTVHNAKLCPGNPDERFVTLLENRGGTMKKGDSMIAYIDKTPVIGCDGHNYSCSVRRVECDLLCLRTSQYPGRCQACQPFRSSLRSIVTRSPRGDNTKPSSHTSFNNLTPTEKNLRLKNLHQLLRAEKKHSKRLEMRVKQLTDGKVSTVSSPQAHMVGPIQSSPLSESSSSNVVGLCVATLTTSRVNS